MTEIIIKNGTIYTMNPKLPKVSALVIMDGKFIYVGDDINALKLAKKDSKIIDLKGGTITPSFIDYHVHAHDGARSKLYEIKIPTPNSLSDLVDKVETVCKDFEPGEWVRIFNNNVLIAEELKTDKARKMIAEVSPDNPVLINLMYHSRFANEVALKAADLFNGKYKGKGVVCDPVSKQPTGLLLEQAGSLVSRVCPQFSTEQQINSALESAEIFNALGVTGFQHAVTSAAQLDAYKALDEANELNIRVSACIATDTLIVPKEEGIGMKVAKRHNEYLSSRICADGVKFFMDGMVPLKTAAMLEPYLCENENYGDLAFTKEELVDKMLPYDKMGLSIKIHAVGDAAIRSCIDAIEEIRAIHGPGKPHSIAHLTYITQEDIARLKTLNIVADLCPPIWFFSDMIRKNEKLLGKERAHRIFPISDILKSGALACASTDWPVLDIMPNPWFTIQTMITRENPSDPSLGKLGADQAITLEQALPLYTINPAKAMGWGDLTGSIEVGKSADFIILNQDPFKVPVSDLLETKTVSTWFEGRKVFEIEK